MDQIEHLPQSAVRGIGHALEKLSLAVIAGIAAFFAAPFLLAFFKRTGEKLTYQLLISAALAQFGGIIIL